jgi:hypothetical protein
MLTACLDESGHETKDWQFVAGFLGNEDQWKKFVPLWQAALGPQRKRLHMAELRWNKEYTRQLLERLGPVPDQCGLVPVVGGVRVSDYEDLVAGSISEKLLKGYMACVYPLVLNVLRTVPSNERLELVFEDQKEYAPYTNTLLSAITGIADKSDKKPDWMLTADGLPKLAKWSFVPKDSTILTDPADYFSYGLLQAWRDKNSKRTRWCQPILNSGKGEGVGRIMRREEIRKVIKTTAEDMFYGGIKHVIDRANRPKRAW